MLAVQAGGPEFNSEHPKLGMGFELITPTPGRWGQAVPGSQSMSQAMGLSKQGGGQEKSTHMKKQATQLLQMWRESVPCMPRGSVSVRPSELRLIDSIRFLCCP